VGETYLKPAETAAKIKVSTDKLALDRMKGIGLPFVVFGTSIRYALSAVEEYMAAHTVMPGRPAPAGVRRRRGGPGCKGLRRDARPRRRARRAA
jgi:hypothetical protein